MHFNELPSEVVAIILCFVTKYSWELDKCLAVSTVFAQAVAGDEALWRMSSVLMGGAADRVSISQLLPWHLELLRQRMALSAGPKGLTMRCSAKVAMQLYNTNVEFHHIIFTESVGRLRSTPNAPLSSATLRFLHSLRTLPDVVESVELRLAGVHWTADQLKNLSSQMGEKLISKIVGLQLDSQQCLDDVPPMFELVSASQLRRLVLNDYYFTAALGAALTNVTSIELNFNDLENDWRGGYDSDAEYGGTTESYFDADLFDVVVSTMPQLEELVVYGRVEPEESVWDDSDDDSHTVIRDFVWPTLEVLLKLEHLKRISVPEQCTEEDERYDTTFSAASKLEAKGVAVSFSRFRYTMNDEYDDYYY